MHETTSWDQGVCIHPPCYCYIILVLLLFPLKLFFMIWPKYYSLVDNKMVNTKMVNKIMNMIKFQKCLNNICYILGRICSCSLAISFFYRMKQIQQATQLQHLPLHSRIHPSPTMPTIWCQHPPVASNAQYSPLILATHLQHPPLNSATFTIHQLSNTWSINGSEGYCVWQLQHPALAPGAQLLAPMPSTWLWCSPLGFNANHWASTLTTGLWCSPLDSNDAHDFGINPLPPMLMSHL